MAIRVKAHFSNLSKGVSIKSNRRLQDNSAAWVTSVTQAVPKKDEVANSILIVQPTDCFKLTINPHIETISPYIETINPHLNTTSQSIESQGNPITITITGKNLYTGSFEKGYFGGKRSTQELQLSKDRKTTAWFSVLAKQGRSLVLSGTAHNRAVWQFRTAEGVLITDTTALVKYMVASDMTQDRTVSKVDIPQDAVAARVYFACLKESNAEMLDDRLQIEYGKVPTAYQPFQRQSITLPSITAGGCITYERGIWKLELQNNDNQDKNHVNSNNQDNSNNRDNSDNQDNRNNHARKTIKLMIPKLQTGDTITIDGPATFSIEITDKPIKRTGIYGVRRNINDRNPICERIGDASGLCFNYVEGDKAATPYDNDFDRIYPWSDIKLCAVKIRKNGKRRVTYSRAKDFATDGSVGNVMVEIPKFYCKREVIEDYEYLWISGTEQEGFTLDPSFLSAEGEPIRKIYVGAYLSTMYHKKLKSISNSYPMIKKSMEKLRVLVSNSKGFTECDLLAVFTIQRLFMVETAVLDSQSLFTGNVQLPYLLKDKNTSYYAIRSEEAANRIFVKRTKVTSRFHVGDAVAVISSWQEYKNKPDLFQREIVDIQDEGEDLLEITFNGEPINIIEREIGITCLPNKTGETDRLPYVTGSISGKSGHASFRYRGIENLWGTVSILIDQAFVKDSRLYIKYPNGKIVLIGYPLPVQKVQLSPTQFGSPTDMIVRTMGYDKDNPLIMFPSEIGNGAITSGYYCDAWYNLAQENISYVITYGGAWDNKGYAGIFDFRASFTKTDAIPYNGSRIMLR